MGRTLNAWVVGVMGLSLAFTSGCGSTADVPAAENGGGAGAGSGGTASNGGSAGAGGTTVSLAGGGTGGSGGGSGASTGVAGASTGVAGASTGVAGASTGVAGGSSGSGGAGAVSTFKIEINYMFDTTGAFTPERRVVLEAAARAWEGLLLSEFEDVPAGTTVRVRPPEQPTQAGMNFPAPTTIDDVAAFVGFADIDGLGNFRAQTSLSFAGGVADPVLLQKLQARYDKIPFQPWLGEISFDLAENWFYDATPDTEDDLPAQQSDFMTTSLHELGHLLGIGNSAAWKSLLVGNQFTGSHAVALYGGPVPVTADLAHVDAVVTQKEDLMMGGTADGRRLHPGPLDLAILEDLGYTVRH